MSVWGSLVVLSALSGCKAVRELRGVSIDYRGSEIRLSHRYSSYEEYKDDPDNIGAEELPRVAELVRRAPVPAILSSKEAVNAAIFEVKFPGYGLDGFGSQDLPDGRSVVASGVEIPHADQTREIVYVGISGSYRRVDDVVMAGDAPVGKIRIDGTDLVYDSPAGQEVRRVSLNAAK